MISSGIADLYPKLIYMDIPMQYGHYKKTISVAIITLNEEDRLPDCLASVAFADDVVVVDSGSTDQTIEIAENFGARVFKKAWSGFGAQKQFAIEQCQGQWILILDADERIPKETAEEITKISQTPISFKGYSIARKNYFMNRWIKHAGWWPDRTIRLFCRDSGCMSNKQVHETMEVDGPVIDLQNPIIHYPFRDLHHLMGKMDHYSSAGARDLYKANKKSSIIKAGLRASWSILYNYLIRGGFLDGGPGLIIAISDAANIFFKYTKLVEMKKNSA